MSSSGMSEEISNEEDASATESEPEEESEQAQVLFPSFNLTWANGFGELLNALKFMSTITEQPVIEITQSGLSFRAMDPTRISLLEIYVPANTFSQYTVEREGKIMVNPKVVEVLGKSGIPSGAAVSIRSNNEKCVLSVDEMQFEAVFGFPPESPPSVPTVKINFTAKVFLNADVLRSVLSSLPKDNPHVEFRVAPNDPKLVIYSEGEVMTLTRAIPCVVESQTSASSDYDPEYLMDALKYLKGRNITLSFGNKIPLMIESSFYRYYLAPRIP